MARWEPNARERLGKAAMELYVERGFDETAVADIAARAGLTERTFFRYFTDKREVIFGGSADFQALIEERVSGAPASMGPLDVVAAALEATSDFFEGRREFARLRHTLIIGHPELQERELIKLASLAVGLAEALRRRGVTEPAASLASEAGVAIFKLAFERWVHDTKQRELAHHIRESLSALKTMAAGQGSAGAGPSTTHSRGSKPGRPKHKSG